MKCNILVTLGLLLLSATILAMEEVDTVAESKERLRQLYLVIHNVAMPEALHAGEISKRLVLMLPGKVLSEKDYFPGQAYVDFQKNPTGDKYEEIPPIIMQNLFRLTDVMPGKDPLQGQESGESFSQVYKFVLGQVDIKGIQELSDGHKKYMQESVEFLLTLVQDPDDVEKEETRWALYRRYEEAYNMAKERMEETIDTERREQSSVDYQYWFQRVYPSLQATVDGAFMDWLVKGDRDRVELYRARLDTSSPGTMLLEARSSLRAAGVTALDRSGTVYPVTFVPGNWFKYLKDPLLPLTQDQKTMKAGLLSSQKKFLKRTRDHDGSMCKVLNDKIGSEERAYNEGKTQLGTNTASLLNAQCNCALNGGTACETYNKDLTETLDSFGAQARKYQYLKALEALRGGNKDAIDSLIQEVDDEMSSLESDPLSVKVPEVAQAFPPVDFYRDNWLQFSYDSRKSVQKNTNEQKSSSISIGISFGIPGLFNIGANVGFSKQTGNVFQKLSTLDTKVSGQLLRVSIQKPWFRPEIFRLSDKFDMRNNIKVSPGPRNSDRAFVQAVTEDHALPQYVTGLLLCRNLELEFSGADKETKASFIRTSLDVGLSVSYGNFQLSFALSHGKQKSSFEASSTTSGLRIRVPGVQMIGYYTEVVPQFPK